MISISYKAVFQVFRLFTSSSMEDNLYIEKGVKAKSNVEQVEKITRIAGELGVEPATPDEAREILGLKGLDKAAY